ncbi:hypothetical protein Arub01_57080 [Actinomadura rubrobrunea]|uniref:Histidine kinase/HSP90-like ATPase domain-containing protein n=1 Tax=Actinomadura rubrobrunea TaxID=115335 RepID=A0A9W6PZZ1_9ACTN|nr:ATP-binding protein [Actinomadura rubrobrunea]GLW67465.1 hypothetical protein Arub01_57080 [Actinomadura rubrobrunea]
MSHEMQATPTDQRPNPLTALLLYAPNAASVSRGRRDVADRVRAWGAANRAADAEQVACELLANAVRHADRSTHITMRLSMCSDQLEIAVGDSSPDVPEARQPNLDDEAGRGLYLVESYSDEWGCDSYPTGKVVWARWRL